MVAGVRASTRSGQSDVLQASNSTAVPTNAVGDTMFLASESWSNSITPTVTWPSGFSQIADQSVSDGSGGTVFLRVARKEITSVDSGSYNITLSGTAWNQLEAVSCSGTFTGADPVEDSDFATGASATSVPSVTNATVTALDLILHIVATFNAVTLTAPSGYTKDIEGDVLRISHKTLSSVASETSSGGTLSSATPKVVIQLAIKPASGATPIDLVIQDMSIATTLDAVTIVPAFNLSVADLSVPTNLDSPSLTRIMDLAIQKMLVATRNDPLTFTQVHNIAIHDMFLYTATDLVNFAGSSGGPVPTVADLQAQKLPVLTGQTGSVPDLLKFYYGGLSGLIPATSYSIADHQRVYWETQTGLTGRSLADLEKAFYDAQLVPSGSLADRAYVYWSGL